MWLSRAKTLHFNVGNFLLSFTYSFLLVAALWLITLGLEKAGCPFPYIDERQFSDLGFFAFSNFSFITFLGMIPFQTAEGKLSPGFYAQIVNRPGSHFGLYLLMTCFVVCRIVLVIYEKMHSPQLLSHFFVVMVASMIFAVFFQRSQTLRYLYQPKIVYENLTSLAKEESFEALWLDLYECTLKAIKENRVSDALVFSNLMAKIYSKMHSKEKTTHLQKDLQSLYKAAKDVHPIVAQLEKNWAFLSLDPKSQASLLATEGILID